MEANIRPRTLRWAIASALAAVAETSQRQCKGASRTLIAAALALSVPVAQAGPVDGEIISGLGSISQSGDTTTIQQSSQNLSLDWASFNIGPLETVNFLQPSAAAIAVNRIFDANGTQILGHINANGQVYLLNPNGVLFGQGAQVNVGGLVASTLDLNDGGPDGNTRTFSGNASGSIVNNGTLNANNGGYIALVGNHVSNRGVITAQLGTVALVGGSAATLTFSGNRLVHMQVDQSVLNTISENGGLIRADGGMVVMTAGARHALLASVVNNTGVIEAHTVENHEGIITLLGGMTGGTVNVGGTLDASAPDSGNGGFIETSAAYVKVTNDASITTAAATGSAGTWLIDPVDFTIAAGSAALTTSGIGADTLSSSLGSGNVSIATEATTAGNGDIFVNGVVSWAANRLTLIAHRNININAALNGSGIASLALEYGQGAAAAANTSTINVRAPVNLAAGNNYSTRLGSDGSIINYTVITGLGTVGSTTGTDLQGINGGLGGYYALGSDIDASATSAGDIWGNSGFAPIGNLATPFTGVFDGLGHAVSGLTINLTTPNVGLFGHTVAGAIIRNVGLVGGSVSGGAGTGGLVGNNTTGAISNSYSAITVTGGAGSGGLVGSNTSGPISNSYATGSVNGDAGSGGLVGSNTSGAISNSFATGNVVGAAGTGGLVGSNTSGPISNSYATGSANGAAGTGGLVGSSTSGLISNTYATGFVTSSGAGVGGLIGSGTASAVSNSYWDTETSIQMTSPGGGTGLNSAEMQQQSSFNAWDFASTWLMYEGITTPFLQSLMTLLTVTANNDFKTYDGQAYSGGSGVTYSTMLDYGAPSGVLNYTGGTSNNAINAGSYTLTPGGLQSDQRYLISYGSGILTVNPATLTATIAAPNKVYDGNTTAAPTLSITSGLVGAEIVTASGTATFNTKDVLTANLVTVNSAVLANGTNGGLASNYSLTSGQTIAANITAKTLTATVAAPDKIYDGDSVAAPTLSITSGLVGTETLSATGAATFNTKDVLTANLVTVNSATLANGTNGGLASNYSLTSGQTIAANITAKTLTATVAAPDKIYDGDSVAAPTLSITSGLVGTETLSATGAATFNTKDVLTANLVTVNSATLANGTNGGLASNYNLATGQTVASSITAANLAISGVTASDKVYDATPTATLGGIATVAALTGDTVNVTGTGSGMFANKDVGTNKTVTVSGFTLGGTDAANYAVVQPLGVTASITAVTVVTPPDPVGPVAPPVIPVVPMAPLVPVVPVVQVVPVVPVVPVLTIVPVLVVPTHLMSVLSPQASGWPRAPSPSAILAMTDSCDSAAQMHIGTRGPALHIVNGGVRLSDDEIEADDSCRKKIATTGDKP